MCVSRNLEYQRRRCMTRGWSCVEGVKYCSTEAIGGSDCCDSTYKSINKLISYQTVSRDKYMSPILPTQYYIHKEITVIYRGLTRVLPIFSTIG